MANRRNTFRCCRLVLGLILFAVLTITESYAQLQRFSLQGREYRLENGKWYTFSQGRKGDEIIPQRLTVRLKNKGRMEAFDFQQFNLKGVSLGSVRFLDGFYVLTIAPDQSPYVIAQTLENTGVFDVLEFDAYGERHSTPSDQYYNNQWNMPRVSAPSAWDITTGSSSIVLAVIDSGTDYNHEDIDGNVWANPIEATGDANGDGYPGIINVDDDGDGLIDEDSEGRQPGEPGYTNDLINDDDENGFADDFVGWDFAGGGNDPQPPYQPDNQPLDTDGHGTSVAGIACAQTNNFEGGVYRGVAGVAGGWGSQRGASLMVLRDGGYQPIYTFTALAIEYAARNGARVINLSTGFSTDYTVVRDAVNLAVNTYGVVVVASAGNYEQGQSTSIQYPAAYSNTIAVGATVENDNRKTLNDGTDEPGWGSCYGPELDVVAPGIHIWTTDISGAQGFVGGNYFDRFNGTSAAAPHVAGTAALIRSKNSTLTWQQVRETIRLSPDKVPGMGGQNFTNEYGYGRLNTNKAVRNLYVPQVYSTIASALSVATSGQTVVVAAGTYTENVTMKYNVDVIGAGSSSTIIDGTVTFNNLSYAELRNVTVNKKVSFTNSSGWLENIDVKQNDYTYGIDVYNGSPSLVHITSTTTRSSSTEACIYSHQNSGPSITVDNIRNKYMAIRIGAYSFVSAYPGFCQNDWDLYAESNAFSSDAYETGTFSAEDPADCIFGNVNYPGPEDWVWCGLSKRGVVTAPDGDELFPIREIKDEWDDFKKGVTIYQNIRISQRNDKISAGSFDPADYADDYHRAIALLRRYVAENSNNAKAGMALKVIDQAYAELGDAKTAFNYLNTLTKNDPLRPHALGVLMIHQWRENEPEKALELANAILTDYDDPDLTVETLYGKGLIYKITLADEVKASEVFAEIVKRFPEHPTAESARYELEGMGKAYAGKSSEPAVEGLSLNSYPNPFNPTMTILYHVPNPGEVYLKVYNVLGQEIRTLVAGRQSAGKYNMDWDGRNDSGDLVGSGLYVVQLRAGEVVQSVKVSLVR